MFSIEFMKALTIPCSDCDGMGHEYRADKRFTSGFEKVSCRPCNGQGRLISNFGQELVDFLSNFGNLATTRYVDEADNYVLSREHQ